MAKKVEKRINFLLFIDATSKQIFDLHEMGKEITRDTFKRYVNLEEFNKIEESLGYSNKHGGTLAKDNGMIGYWKCKHDYIPGNIMVYQPSLKSLYVFAGTK